MLKGGISMAIKEFFRKLNYEIKRRENTGVFALLEFYFPEEKEGFEELDVGETQVSVKLQPER